MADEWDDEVESGQNFASANYSVPVPSSSKGTDDDWNNEPIVSSSNKNKEDDDWGKDDNNSSENRNDFGGRRGGGGRGGRFINGRTFNRDDRNGYGNKNGHGNDDEWSKNDNGDDTSRNRENNRGGGRGRGGRGRDRDGGGDRDRNGGFGRDRDGGGERGRSGGFGRDRDGGGDRGRNGDFGRDRDGGGNRGRDGGGDRDRNGGFGRDRDRKNGSNEEGKNFGDNDEKKRELYIPPEPTEDEKEIFGQGISTGINFSKYDSIPVKVSGDDPPKPISCFDEANLKSLVLDNVKKSGYTKPTPIQKNGIPIVMGKRDLMACAQTGSGKTAAFLLPIINDLLTNSQDLSVGKPHALIVSPTRELTIQIFEEARKFARGSYLKITIVYGGTGVKHQGDNIGKGCHILVATPGRLLDFVERGSISFEDCRFVVLDEADRMLDMGFLPSVEKVMDNPTMTPQTERQTLMFSATFPQEIQHLAGRFLNNYIFLAVGIVGGACADVEQNFYEVTRFSKRAKLTDILDENENNARGTMVFVETQRNADFLASLLSETKYPTTSIHGARLQREREMALRDFKNGKMSVLIATSVAARGLDIKNVDHVINYDLPKSIDEYVHRIGRTGRVGNKGKATSFFDSEHDAALAPDLIKILQQADQEVPDFLSNAGGNRSGSYNSDNFGGKDVRTMEKNSGVKYAVPEPHEPVEDW